MNLFVGGVSLAWTGIDSEPRRRYSLKRTVYSSRRPTMEQLRKVPQNSNFRGRTNEAATKEKRKRPHAKSTPLLLGALHAPSHYCSSKEGGSRERKGRTDGRTDNQSKPRLLLLLPLLSFPPSIWCRAVLPDVLHSHSTH